MASEFKINKAYAEKYNTWRAKEELQKLKSRYGNVDINDDLESSSSSESEDEDADALTAQLDKEWLKTLAALKSKDPKIYNKDVKFYQSDEEAEDKPENKKAKKQKPVFLKDYDRKIITERDGQLSSDDSDDGYHGDERQPGYYEEQEEIRKSLKSAILESEEESSGDEFLTKRWKTKQQKAAEEEDYLTWLKGQSSELSDGKQAGIELEPLKDYWSNPGLDSGEKFLRDYMLNRGYIDKDADRIPTYYEVVEGDFSDEEEQLEKEEGFERKYNFRYEEPDPEIIKSYPRTIDDTVRRKDTTRADKRSEVKERKKKEKEQKKEEIKQLKNLKKKEIMDKIEKLKQITGNASLGFNDNDLDEDFDPKKHDEMMKKYFDKDYYDEGEGEDQKPDAVLDDEDLQIENWDAWEGAQGEYYKDDGCYDDEAGHVDDEDFNMDADYDPTQADSKKKKKKSKFSKAVNKTKPVFDPGEKTFDEYLDEYYKLDCEDVIGDIPCRFRYRQVMANDYGLGVNEILTCRDKELNTWVSVKKMSQYMTKEEEEKEVYIYRRKGGNQRKKLNVLVSLKEEQEGSQEQQMSDTTTEEMRKEKRKKKKKKKASALASEDLSSKTVTTDTGKKRKREKEEKSPHKKARLEKGHTANKGKSKVEKRHTLDKGKKGHSPMAKGAVPKKFDFSMNNSVKKVKIESAVKSPTKAKADIKMKKSVENSGNKARTMVSDVRSEVTGVRSDVNQAKSNVTDVRSEVTGVRSEVNKSKSNVTDMSSEVGVPGKVKTASKKPTVAEQSADTGKKSKKKKKKKKTAASQNVSGSADGQKVKKTDNRFRKKPAVTDERLLAYGINPKKFKYMKLKKFEHDQS